MNFDDTSFWATKNTFYLIESFFRTNSFQNISIIQSYFAITNYFQESTLPDEDNLFTVICLDQPKESSARNFLRKF